MFERLAVLIQGLSKHRHDKKAYYLFVSMPHNYEDDTDDKGEGMVGQI